MVPVVAAILPVCPHICLTTLTGLISITPIAAAGVAAAVH